MRKSLLYKVSILLVATLTLTTLHSCGDDDITTTSTPPPPQQNNLEGNLEFVKTYGGSELDEAVAIVPTDDGNFMVFGSTQSIDGDITGKTTTDTDYWLLKISPTGALLFNKTYGGSGNDEGTNITKTRDGGFVLSGYSRSNDGDVSENNGFQDQWLVKINANGDIQWEKSFGFLGGDQAFKIFETSTGNFFVTGYLDVSASNGAGNDFTGGTSTEVPGRNSLHGVGEYWGLLLDSNGNKIWRRYFGGENNDRSYDAVETDDGGFLMVGSSESESFDIDDAKGSYDYWAVRLTSNGDLVWATSFGGPEIDNGYALIKTDDGNYVMVGDTRSTTGDVTTNLGNADAWMIKFSDNDGALLWDRSAGGSEFDSARGITKLANGNFAVTGNTRSNVGNLTSNKGQNDAWVYVTDPNGVVQFNYTVGGSSLDFAQGLAETTENALIVVGSSESNDNDIPQNRGSKDLLIFKIK